MKPFPFPLFSAILIALPIPASAQLFSWETETEGWTAASPNHSIANSTTGVTHGVQSLQVTNPMSDQWYSVATSLNLSEEQRQSIFTDATELKIDVSYPNPGYTSWFVAPSVEVIIQGEKVGWAQLGAKEVSVDGASPQTVTFPLTVAQADGMATGNWGQILLKFVYGNGGVTSSTAVFYVDNLINVVVPDVLPPTAFFWKGAVDANWGSLNWTSDAAGTVAGGVLPADGSAGIAFAATDAGNLSTDLGGDQWVKSIAVLDGVGPVSISGTNSLTLGSGGIWMADIAGFLTIDTSGGVILESSQVWKNNSPSATLTVDSAVSGPGTLSKSGAGPVILAGSNIYTGGTIVQLGTLILGDVAALGAPSGSLFMEGGTLDLNGFSPTIGALTGNSLGVIHNSSFTPSVLTLGSDDVDSVYNCVINDGPGGGAVSIVKKGSRILTSNTGGNFTGNMTIQDGQFVANTSIGGVPNSTSFGNAQTPGRTVTVEIDGSVLFNTNNVLGNASGDPSVLPEFILNESLMESNRYNILGNITLNGATLTHNSSDTGAYAGYQFRGNVVVTGANPSFIASLNGKGYHLSAATTFTIADGDASEDLIISAPLLDQSGDFGSAAGGLIKEGGGTLALQSASTYTGDTVVEDGDLSLYFPSLSDSGALEVADGATVNLYFEGIDTVGSLVLGGNPMTQPGTYGAENNENADFTSPAITGLGLIELQAVSPDPYGPWIATFPSLVDEETARGEDPDRDGLTNIQEFAFNSIPNSGVASGKIRSSVQTIGSEQVLVLTLPVRDGAIFDGTTPASATLAAEKLGYRIEGSDNLTSFNQPVSEVIPAASAGLPALDTGWTYRSFRLKGNIGGTSPRGPKGFLRAVVIDTP